MLVKCGKSHKSRWKNVISSPIGQSKFWSQINLSK